MKNKVSVLTMLSVIVLMIAKIAVADPVAVARHAVAPTTMHKQEMTTMNVGQLFGNDVGTAGKSLMAAALLSDGLTAGRYEEFQLEEVLSKLDYVTSKSLRFAVPKTRYSVVLNWGFGGAGEHNLEFMLPLPTVPLTLEFDEDADNAPSVGRDGALVGFGKMVLENELNKITQASKGDLTKVLQGLGITPILKPRAIFLLKLALLIQHTLKTQDMSFFTNELGFLLCRLVLSGDISIPGTKDASLTSLLPQSAVESINKMAPNLLPMIDTVFVTTKKMFSSLNNEDALSGLKTLTYVFKDSAAVNSSDAFKDFAATVLESADCEEQLEKYIADNHMQAVDWDDFCEVQNGVDVHGLNFIVGKLVSYGNDHSMLVETALLTAAQGVDIGKAGTVYVAKKGPFTVVCCRTDKASFDMSQTFSALAAAVAQAWGSYMKVVHSEVAQGHELDVNELLLEDAQDRKILRKFFKSAQGQEFAARLEQALQSARNPFEKMRLKHAQVERELSGLENELTDLARLIDEKEAARAAFVAQVATLKKAALIIDRETFPVQRTVVSRPHNDAKIEKLNKLIVDIQVEIADLMRRKADLEDKIAVAETTCASFSEQIGEHNADTQRLQIDQLMQIMQTQHAAGKGIDADLRSRIEGLQRELVAKQENAEVVQKQAKLSAEEKLELRAAVLDVYERELGNVSVELARCKKSKTSELDVYKKFLTARVARMQKQQEDLQELLDYKEAVAQGALLTTERQAEFYDLERSLGFIFESNDVVDICRIARKQPSIAHRFVQEIAQPVRGSAFEAMHKEFVGALSSIIGRSTCAQKNAVMVKYALSMLFPDAQSKVLEQIMQGVRA